MPTHLPRNRLADLGLFYAALVWGATFFLVKDALASVDPVVLVAYRFLSAGLILLVVLGVQGKPLLRDLGKGAWLAVILWLLYVPQTVGLGITTASNSGFITGLFVAFVPIFMSMIFHRQPTLMEWIASGISLIGLWILTGGMTDVNAGDVLTLLAAVTYALHLLYSDRYMKQGVDPFILVCQQFLIVGLLSLVSALVLDLDFTVHSTGAFWVIAFLSLVPTLSAFVIQLLAQKVASPLRASLIFALEPLFAAVFAWTIGGEQWALRGAVGGLVISIALMLSGLPTPAFISRFAGRRA
ncbi:MAG: DMT family transporter [Candidatus Zixiibacteriota bacterium]